MSFWTWNVALSMKDSDVPPHEHHFPIVVERLPSGYEMVAGRRSCTCGMTYSEWNKIHVTDAAARFLRRRG